MKPTKRKQPVRTHALAITISVLTLLVFIGLYQWIGSVGKAVYIDNAVYNGENTINLAERGSFALTRLPEEQASVLIQTGVSLTELSPNTLNLSITKIDDTTYQLKVDKVDSEHHYISTEVLDLLSTLLPEDTSIIYLPGRDGIDAIPDLKVSLKDRRITVTNLHYLGLSATQILLVTPGTYQALPNVISLQPGQVLTAIVNATSQYLAPTITVNDTRAVFTNSRLFDPAKTKEEFDFAVEKWNFTNGTMTFTAPALAGAYTLDLIATVGNQHTHHYYTLAVGNVAYALPASAKSPSFIITLQNERQANITINLPTTTELQPFALPCEPTGDINALVGNSPIQKIYTYDPASHAPLVWTKNAPSDFASFDQLQKYKGYFIQSSGSGTLTIPCTVKSLQSLGPVPALGAAYSRLGAGWNLIALPGLIPRSLSEFTQDKDFTIYSCEQGYPCTTMSAETALLPGRVYWLYSSTPLTLYYRLE